MLTVIIVLLLIVFGILIINHTKLNHNHFDYDFLVVLGHKLINDKPSKILNDRLNIALPLIKDNKVILCGGITKNNTISEAQVMKNYLIKKDITEESIILEDKSKTTIENFKNIKEIIKDKRILVITSDYHTYRSSLICKDLNIKASFKSCESTLIEKIYHAILEEIFILKYVIFKS